MEDTMLSKALSYISGPLGQLLKNLEGKYGPIWFKELNRFLRKEKCWVNALYAPGETVAVSAITEEFILKEKFIVNTDADAPVRICDINTLSEEPFSKISEKDIEQTVLHYHELWKETYDIQIIEEFGYGENFVKFAHIYFLVEQQGRGTKGDLLTNGCANIFYVKNWFTQHCVILVAWTGEGWHFRAYSTSPARTRNSGSRIFSNGPVIT